MNNNNSGLGEKILEAGISSMKAGADEIKTSVSTAIGQVTGQQVKTDQELQQIASQDKEASGKRINEIQQELSAQKMRRFHEVNNFQPPPPQPTETHNSQPSETTISAPLASRSGPRRQPESVRQVVGKSELGRNFKG